MRNGLFLGALLATLTIGGTALADRSGDSEYRRTDKIREQVQAKQKEGLSHKSSSARSASRSDSTQKNVRERVVRPHGDVYGDQATRSGASRISSGGKNFSATNSVNTPTEIKAMLKMINPMLGAYRTSQAQEGADSYGGGQFGKAKTADQRSKNLSATSTVNTPKEIQKMLHIINPMAGAYSTCAAADGTDSYTSNINATYGALLSKGDRAVRNVHFKNDKGEVLNSLKADTSTAKKNTEARERLAKNFADKMSKKVTVKEVAPKSADPKQ